MLPNTCFLWKLPLADAVGLRGTTGRRTLGGTNACRAGADKAVERKMAKGSGTDKFGCEADEVASA